MPGEVRSPCPGRGVAGLDGEPQAVPHTTNLALQRAVPLACAVEATFVAKAARVRRYVREWILPEGLSGLPSERARVAPLGSPRVSVAPPPYAAALVPLGEWYCSGLGAGALEGPFVPPSPRGEAAYALVISRLPLSNRLIRRSWPFR